MSDYSLSPEGFWMKSHFYREGNLLHVVTYSCIAGNPEVFRMSVDLRTIVKGVVRAHNMMSKQKVSGEDVHSALMGYDDALVGGFFDSVTKPFSSVAKSAANMVNKVGKSKLISQVGSAVKSVVKSKITGGIIAATAVAFPAVGVPALAAYAAANATLSAIEQAKGAVDTAKKIVNKATSPATAKKLKGELNKWAGSTISSAIANKVRIPSGMNPLAQAMKIAKDRADHAKKVLKVIASKSKTGDVEASKMARIVTLAHNNRKSLSSIRKSTAANMPKLKGKAPVSSNLNGFPALLVSKSGRIIPGRYVEKSGGDKSVILRGGKVLRGNFAAVSGVHDYIGGCFGADYSDDFGSVGMCSNPTMKPAHLR